MSGILLLSDLHYHHKHFSCYHYCLSSLLPSLSWFLLFKPSWLLSLKLLSPSGVSLFKVLSRIYFCKQTRFHPYLQNVLTISPTKRCQPFKTEIRSKYETGSSCTLVKKTRIKSVSCGYSRYTTLWYLNQQSHRKKFK